MRHPSDCFDDDCFFLIPDDDLFNSAKCCCFCDFGFCSFGVTSIVLMYILLVRTLLKGHPNGMFILCFRIELRNSCNEFVFVVDVYHDDDVVVGR